jgi:hypothetical protein
MVFDYIRIAILQLSKLKINELEFRGLLKLTLKAFLIL